VIDRAIEADPEAASAEYGAEFRGDLEIFVSREAIEACVATGVTVRAPLPRVTHHAFVDPSGGSNDAMTCAIGHKEEARVILDCILERKAPFSPDSVVGEFSGTLKAYGVSTVTGDRYAGEWPAERFSAHGIRYAPAELNRSELYLAFLPLVNSGRVDLLDNARMVSQFVGLERRTSRGGRDSIDHAPGGHDDVANAVAGVAWLASASKSFPAHAFSAEASQAFAAAIAAKFPNGPGVAIVPRSCAFLALEDSSYGWPDCWRTTGARAKATAGAGMPGSGPDTRFVAADPGGDVGGMGS
jgi:hypothetical protein